MAGIYLLLAFYIAQYAEQDNKQRADVILVLGAKACVKNAYNVCLVARVAHAVKLYKAHYAPKIIFSGGNDKEDHANESQVMKKIALLLGVPQKDIFLESMSTSTYENMAFSKKILNREKMQRIILVTEPFHLPRALLVARKLKLNVVGSPAANSKCWSSHKYLSPYFLKEPLAIIFYKLKNRI